MLWRGSHLGTFTNLITKAKAAFSAITDAFQGRSTIFAVFFAIVATILAFMGKLTDDYVHVIFAIQGYVLGHSIKEDYFNKPDPGSAPDTN